MGYRSMNSKKNRRLKSLERDFKALKIRYKVLERVVIDTQNEYHRKFLQMESNVAYTSGMCAENKSRIERLESKQRELKCKIQTSDERNNQRYFFVLNKLKGKLEKFTFKEYLKIAISAFLGSLIAFLILI